MHTNAQGLLLSLCSGGPPRGAWGMIFGAGDQTRSSVCKASPLTFVLSGSLKTIIWGVGVGERENVS